MGVYIAIIFLAVVTQTHGLPEHNEEFNEYTDNVELECDKGFYINPHSASMYNLDSSDKQIHFCDATNAFLERCGYGNSCFFSKRDFQKETICAIQQIIRVGYNCTSYAKDRNTSIMEENPTSPRTPTSIRWPEFPEHNDEFNENKDIVHIQCAKQKIIYPHSAALYNLDADDKQIEWCNSTTAFYERCGQSNNCFFSKEFLRQETNCTNRTIVRVGYDCVSKLTTTSKNTPTSVAFGSPTTLPKTQTQATPTTTMPKTPTIAIPAIPTTPTSDQSLDELPDNFWTKMCIVLVLELSVIVLPLAVCSAYFKYFKRKDA